MAEPNDLPSLDRDDLLNPEWCAAVDDVGASALAAMLADHVRCAVRELNNAQHLGYAAYVRMMLGWIDTLLHHIGLPADPSTVGLIKLEFTSPDQRDRIDTDTVPSSSRWAGRLMAARAIMDHDTCEALVRDDVGGDGFSSRVIAVLTGVAATLRYHPDSTVELRARHTDSPPC